MSTHPHILDSTCQEGLAGLGKDWYKRWGKQAFDFVAAAIALIFSSPLLVICSLLVRLTSRGPIFFRQVRVGRDGSRFKVFKFRTMKQEAEQEGPAPRSEEHTSELQSLAYLVCRLLLEKKKKNSCELKP